MRILAVADLHYALRQFDWVRCQMEHFDLVVVAGDLLDLGSPVDLDTQAVAVSRILRRWSAHGPVVAASGNHDLNGIYADTERAAVWLQELAADPLRVDDQCWEKDGVLVSVCRWWDGPRSRARMLERLQQDAARPKNTWIWVHHNPPDACPIAWTGRHFAGDAELPLWIERWRPDFVLCGHVHHAPFYPDGAWQAMVGGARVFNPGRQPGPVPAAIALDLDHHRAEWWSAEGIEAVEWPPSTLTPPDP